MYYIRQTQTSSKATAVQVVEYVKRKMVIAVHIGSAHTPEDLIALQELARKWMEKHGQTGLFQSVRQPSNQLQKFEYTGIRYIFIYEVLHKLMAHFQFATLGGKLLHDLVVIRIIEPASKLESLALLKRYFGIHHRRQSFYESLPKLVLLKDAAEKLTVARAKEEFNFDFSLVFYDVTTLYYESFEADDLRKHGFSKDGKPQQPQIVLGLVVNADGFPVSYEIFEGNKFEGHTIIPVIKSFKEKHSVSTLTIVADAAMISSENVKALEENSLNYIVGARMGNISPKLIKEISQTLGGRDKETTRIKTPLGELVADFSVKRYAKDKREMEKQIKKAELLVNDPTKVKRAKFLKTGSTYGYELNAELVDNKVVWFV